ncbi:porin family protein [Marinobacter persicus]|uniref:Opacity protein-like surface antigen n=1 Tax=Marinobacter persicus TaxID=930118 RepID=A0A2S6G8H9_9GAMM|nr:porin family protein [Marinobacter persicus]PPK52549.1 opacity protein-like surface antigen [Marinobacter persicus]PPK55522.1 opacity protein-like surface antigen [Marinobacter persicus]PPK58488.1 opacity protein-like surface antigen [Marinobacter persicus]
MNSGIRFAIVTAITASAFAAPAAWAQSNMQQDQAGPYITGSYGGYKSHGGEFDDENDLLGAGVGYQFSEFFAVEAEYIDFGDFGNDEVEGQLKGAGLSAIGRLPLTQSFGIYGKVGAFASAFDVDAFDESETYDEVNPYVGAGVDFRITQHLTAFAQYDRFNVDIDESDFNGQITNDGPDFDTGRLGLKFKF